MLNFPYPDIDNQSFLKYYIAHGPFVIKFKNYSNKKNESLKQNKKKIPTFINCNLTVKYYMYIKPNCVHKL